MPNKTSKVYTIGFTRKPASAFFEKLRAAGVKRVIDVRLNNVSQLAAFSKCDDLQYFLKTILRVGYIHMPLLAPTKEMRDQYLENRSWQDYERDFLALMAERKIEDNIDPDVLAGGCLLCSEHEPNHCHRRLVAEYLKRKWGKLNITHLV